MSDNQQAEIEQPFISHLLELRDRLLRMIIAVLVFFVVMFPFANDIYVFVAEPLMAHLPEGTSMIATQVASPFLTPFKMSLVGSVFLAMPYILYQFWSFVAPGLYLHERKMIIPLLASSVALFYLGMVFAYFVVFPLVFGFLTSAAPEGVAVMTDITSYLDFVLTLFFAFGIAFEVPIATIVLVMMGVTTPEKLRKHRPYIVVAAFIIGMFLTPPDVISQTLLALPMWLLFEIGVFFSATLASKKQAEEGEDAAASESVDAEENSAPQAATAAAASTKTATEQPPQYPDDFVPLSDAEMEAELNRLDEDDEDEDEDDDDDIYSDHDDHSGDGGTEPVSQNRVDVKLAQATQYRSENNEKAARGLLYEVLEEGDESQIRTARNILADMDSL